MVDREQGQALRAWQIVNPNAPVDRVEVGDLAGRLISEWPARDGDGNPITHIGGDQLIDAMRREAVKRGIDPARVETDQVVSILRDRGVEIEDVAEQT